MGFIATGLIAIVVFYLIGFVLVKSSENHEERTDNRRRDEARKSYSDYVHEDEKPRRN